MVVRYIFLLFPDPITCVNRVYMGETDLTYGVVFVLYAVNFLYIHISLTEGFML